MVKKYLESVCILLNTKQYFLKMLCRRSLSDKSGLDLQAIVDAVCNFQSRADDRHKLLNYLTNSFDHYVSSIGNDDYDSSGVGVIGGGGGGFQAHDSSMLHKRRSVYNSYGDSDMNKKALSDDSDDEDDYDDDMTGAGANRPVKSKRSRYERFRRSLARFGRLLCLSKGSC